MSNIQKGSGLIYTTGIPNTIPVQGTDSEFAIDVNGNQYAWNRNNSVWDNLGQAIEIATSSGVPTHIPSKFRPRFVVTPDRNFYFYASGWGSIGSLPSGVISSSAQIGPTGIYSGSGVVPDATTAILDGGFIIAHSAGYILFDGTGVGEGVRAVFGPNGIIYTQDAENYLFDFNPLDGYIEFRTPGGALTLNASSSLLSSVGVQPISYTSAAAPNNCIFYSTTLSKLCYKDPGGTVNPLY